MTTRNLPTLQDVAAMAGVSTATVSRFLNAPNVVRAPTRERIRAAVDALGYMPNFGGRALVSNRTDSVGAVIPTMDNAIFARGVQAAQERLSESGVTLLIASSGYDVTQERAQIAVLLSRGVDGLLLIGEARPPETYALLQRRGTPFVLAWSHREACPHVQVGFDNRAAARAMAATVVAAGHRDIAMIAGRTSWNDRAADRLAGVRDALAAAGLGLPPERVIEADYSIDAGAAALRRFAALTPRPTAVICGNDVLAAGALHAARDLGLAVPQALSITGFDDIDIAAVTVPPLTTVHVPHRRMGRMAAEALLEMRDGSRPGRSVRLEATLTPRGSLGPAPAC